MNTTGVTIETASFSSYTQTNDPTRTGYLWKCYTNTFFLVPKEDRLNMDSIEKLWTILCFHSSLQRRCEKKSCPSPRPCVPNPPINNHFPYRVHRQMITSSFRVHQWWSITMSKNLWALKIALNLMDTLATQCILFIFSPFVSFCNLKSIFRKQTILHDDRYVQSNVQTCDISLWGSNLRLVHSLNRMCSFCQHGKCRPWKCALCFFPPNTSYVGSNTCCINTCCYLNIKCAHWKITQGVFSEQHIQRGWKQNILFKSVGSCSISF